MAAAKKNSRLNQILRDLLAEPVDVDSLKEEEIAKLLDGCKSITNAEAIMRRVVDAGVSGKQWAIEFIMERSEGKAIAAEKPDSADAQTEERLNHLTAQHLNTIANALKPTKDEVAVAKPDVVPAAGILDLPKSNSTDDL